MKIFLVSEKKIQEISKSLGLPISKGSNYIFINLPKTQIRQKYRLIHLHLW